MGYWVVDAACWSRMALIKGTKMKLDQSEMFLFASFWSGLCQKKIRETGNTKHKFLHFGKHQQIEIENCFLGKGRPLKKHNLQQSFGFHVGSVQLRMTSPHVFQVFSCWSPVRWRENDWLKTASMWQPMFGSLRQNCSSMFAEMVRNKANLNERSNMTRTKKTLMLVADFFAQPSFGKRFSILVFDN